MQQRREDVAELKRIKNRIVGFVLMLPFLLSIVVMLFRYVKAHLFE